MRPDYLSLSSGNFPLPYGGAGVGVTTLVPSSTSGVDRNSVVYKITHPSQGEMIAAGVGGVGGFLLFGILGAVIGAVGLPIALAAIPLSPPG